MKLSKFDESFLINLAKKSIELEFDSSINLNLFRDSDIEILNKKRGCFVTLYKNNSLRGCIGSIYPNQKLFDAIIDNSKKAAFNDPRFSELRRNELKDIRLEISILSNPKEIIYKNKKDLLNYIEPMKDGIILKKGIKKATYLPQVWKYFYDDKKQDYDKKSFILNLCKKAGIDDFDFNKLDLDLFKYQAYVFSE